MKARSYAIPLEPYGKARPRVTHRLVKGKVYSSAHMPKGYTQWKADAAWFIRDKTPLDGPLFMQIELIKRRPKSVSKSHADCERLRGSDELCYRTTTPDADNAAGTVMDLLQELGVIRNDSQIAWLSARSLYAPKGEAGRVLVQLVPLRDAPELR